MSRFIPLTIPSLNSFYQNRAVVYDLKDILKNEGILKNPGSQSVIQGVEVNSTTLLEINYNSIK